MTVCRFSRSRRLTGGLVCSLLLSCLLPLVSAQGTGDITVSPGAPNELRFAAQPARFVRFVVMASHHGQVCVDELEVYGPESDENLAPTAAAAASSCLAGHAQHRVAHLNDGRYGNAFSWIAAGVDTEWAELRFPDEVVLDRLVFSRDRYGEFSDRVPTTFQVRLSLDGESWTTVADIEAARVVVGSTGRRDAVGVSFLPHHASRVRLLFRGTQGGVPVRVTEVTLAGEPSRPPIDLTDGRTRVRASSVAAGNPGTVTDGSVRDGGWTAARAAGEWLEVLLPEQVEISRVVVYTHSGVIEALPRAFDVLLGRKDGRWKQVASYGRPEFPAVLPPPASSALSGPGLPLEIRAGEVPDHDGNGYANLALSPGVRVSVSSTIPGHPEIHRAEHLVDGRFGNRFSWVAESMPAWVELDLGRDFQVYRVCLGSDTLGDFQDRAATRYQVLTAPDAAGSEGREWTCVARARDDVPVTTRTSLAFEPVEARWVRIEVAGTNGNAVRIDELEVYGSPDPLDRERIGPVAPHPGPVVDTEPYEDRLRRAFLAEEHAWLKTGGWADVEPRLRDYLRVWEFPRPKPRQVLPLPTLSSSPPVLDGRLGRGEWDAASRATVRVAVPTDFAEGPLVEYRLAAVIVEEYVYFALRADRWLSAHLAALSTGDWQHVGLVRVEGETLGFAALEADSEPLALDAALDRDAGLAEWRVPLERFPGLEDHGLRVGLGIGGAHTDPAGREVLLFPDAFALAEAGLVPDEGAFSVTVRAVETPDTAPVRVRVGDVAASDPGTELVLAAGERSAVRVTAVDGPAGLEARARVESKVTGRTYELQCFRYDPARRALRDMRELLTRLAWLGLDVGAEQQELERLDAERRGLVRIVPEASKAAERDLFFRARLAKRRLMMRSPALATLPPILCARRRNFEPSHNYSVILDAVGGGGGGISLLHFPSRDGQLLPGEVTPVSLFESGEGIARTPAPSPDLSQIYFGYCRTKGDYYHIWRMAADGTGLEELTHGPFHDYWPCPLPDGGLAFISTRCRQRFLCWRPQAAVLFRMNTDGSDMRPLSFANLTEWAPSVTRDGRILWTRSEYQDKGADHGHTLWTIRPDGSYPELAFGNTLLQPNGFANGREVPGSSEIVTIPISHFGDLNGPLCLVDPAQGRFNPDAVTSLTPEVPWPGAPPLSECFRDPVPLDRDHFLVSHSPRTDRRFELYVVDRFGNREWLFSDPDYSVVCPIPFRPEPQAPSVASATVPEQEEGEFFVADVYRGLGPDVPRGSVRYIRVSQEVRDDLERMEDGSYRSDHVEFMDWYASPVHRVAGPKGWPSYVAKASWGLVEVQPDGSARFPAPAGRVLYFSVLDEEFNEVQRMRSVVQLQPGEKRGCIGCHESRQAAPALGKRPLAKTLQPRQMAPWEGQGFDYAKVVQPVLNSHCVSCHNGEHPQALDLRVDRDEAGIPASYRTLIGNGLVDHFDWTYRSSPEKAAPLHFGSRRSRLVQVLTAGHHGVSLDPGDWLRVKTWIDLNCPLWPDYTNLWERAEVAGKQ